MMSTFDPNYTAYSPSNSHHNSSLPPLPYLLQDLTSSIENSTASANMTTMGYLPPNAADTFPPPPDVAIQVLGRFHLIAVPAIVVLGILGNTLSFCIFVSKTLRRTSCSLYLAARCLSDTGFLLSVFITWLGDAMGVPVIHTPVVCQVVVFASYVFGFLSVWLVVCITLENYIRICHPFSVCRLCTVQRARRVLVALLVLSVLIYQFPLWTTHVAPAVNGQQFCGNKAEFMEIFQALVYADMAVTLALPSVVIIFFMIAICISLVHSLKRQSRLKGQTKRLQLPPNNQAAAPTITTPTTINTTTNGLTTPTTTPRKDPPPQPLQTEDPPLAEADLTRKHQTQDSVLDPQAQDEEDHNSFLLPPQIEPTNGDSAQTSTMNKPSAKSTKAAQESATYTPPPPPSMTLPAAKTASSCTAQAAIRRSVRGSVQAKVTRLLFAVSFTFLVLSLPSHIVRLRMMMLMMVEQTSSLSPSLEEMLQVVFQILYYLSFAINLLVYLSCGESFRKVFLETYITCFLGRRSLRSRRRRRSELSRTSYTMVKAESPTTMAAVDKATERETSLDT